MSLLAQLKDAQKTAMKAKDKVALQLALEVDDETVRFEELSRVFAEGANEYMLEPEEEPDIDWRCLSDVKHEQEVYVNIQDGMIPEAARVNQYIKIQTEVDEMK